MPQPIIEVKNLSKQYKIGADTTYKTLSGSITDTLRSPLKSLKNYNKQNEIFWALKDINFEVNRGEVVGIIGRNGAGKSTLLKVLSRITHPTEGEIKLRGRVGSLLEVGTGFHPELTGRENIYFNGAILGMKKREIDEKFDEIVRFAEIDKFLDTPVKRYSSGMYVRLAFAVAAHMDPEILIVDEVLAVGDAAFQKKCLGKMKDVSEGGRTVLFVSHNMAAIRQLCSSAMWIDNGTVSINGCVSEVTETYLSNTMNICTAGVGKKIPEDQEKEFQVLSVRLIDKTGKISHQFECDDQIILELECISRVAVPALYGYLSIDNKDGTNIWASDTHDIGPNCLESLKPGKYTINIRIPPRTIGHGEYLVKVVFQSSLAIRSFFIDNPGYVCNFSVSDHRTERGNHRVGYISTLLKWEIM